MTHFPRAVGIFSVVFVLALTGCSNRLQTERDNLWTQNEELQTDVERLRALLDRKDAQIFDLESRQSELLAQQGSFANTAAASTATSVADDPFAGLEDGITSTVTDARVTIRIPGDVLFAAGKVELQKGVQKSLNRIASIIGDEYPTEIIRVEGYTDTDPIKKSGWKDNLELSLQRAAAVTRYLAQRGVDADRLYAAGFGEHHPLASKDKSRRVEIVVVLK